MTTGPGFPRSLLRVLGDAAAAWNRFWFRPSDPTTLGFMRICCGLLTVYTHLAYTYDLQEFFGKDAWLSHETVTRYRREAPWMRPYDSWEPPAGMAYIPPPERDEDQRAVRNFIARLPTDPGQREQVFKWVIDPPLPPPMGLNIPQWVLDLPVEPPEQKPRDGRRAFVNFLRDLPKDEAARDDLLSYVYALRTDPNADNRHKLPETRVVVRPWGILEPSSAALLDGNLAAVSNADSALIWTPTPAGDSRELELALEKAPAFKSGADGKQYSAVRCQLNALTADYINLALNSTTGVRIWLDRSEVSYPKAQTTLYVTPGAHTLTVLLDRDDRKGADLRVNVDDSSGRAKIIEYVNRWKLDPRDLAFQGWYSWSIWYHVTDPGWMLAIHIAFLGVMVLFTLGFCTRVTAALTWLAALSYFNRSEITLFGVDTMMNILLLYLMIGPSGAALSLDRVIRRWWINRQRAERGRPLLPDEPPAPTVGANLATRLLQVHFCIIYLAAGTAKLLGPAWWNGTAIYLTMANFEFSPLAYGSSITFLRWLCQHRWLWEIVMTGGSWFTVGLEISLPFLIWNRRLRPIMVTCSVLLHTSIALTMGLTVFSLLMATLVLAFVPGEFFETALGLARRGVHLVAGKPAVPTDEPGRLPEPRSTAIKAG